MFLSSAMTILLIGTYALFVFIRKHFAAILAMSLSAIYAFLFVTLESQDYALLLGSLGLFVILAILMFITRGVVKKTIGVKI